VAICCSASQRERATESVPPRACHLERSAPPSAAGVGCGWCSGAVIEQQAPARHAECTRDASSSAKQRAAPNSVRQRRERSPCRLVHAVGESSCERHHVEPRRRFLPWPPRLVSATRWGAAEAEACASRARDQQAAWEGAHTPRRSRAKRGVAPGHSRHIQYALYARPQCLSSRRGWRSGRRARVTAPARRQRRRGHRRCRPGQPVA